MIRLQIIVTTVILFSSYTLIAQADKVTVLLKAYEAHQTEDQAKLDMLVGICYQYSQFDAANTFKYGNEALRLGRKLGVETHITPVHAAMATIYNDQGEFDSAFHYINIALASAIKREKPQNIALCKIFEGRIYVKSGDYDKGQATWLEAERIARENNLTHLIGVVLNDLGNAYRTKGDLTRSVKYYLRSLDHSAEVGDSVMIAYLQNNLGNIYHLDADYGKALSCYLVSIKICKKIHEPNLMGNAYYGAGVIYTILGKLDSAEYFLNWSRDFYLTKADSNMIATTYSGLGLLYSQKKMYEEAEQKFKEAIGIYERIQEDPNISYSYQQYGELLKEQGKHKQALKKYLKANELAFESKNPFNYTSTLNNIYKNHKEQGNYTMALKYLEKLEGARDSLEAMSITLTDLERDYEIGLKNSEIKTLSRVIALQRQRLLIIIGAMGLLLLLIVAAFRNRVLKARNEQLYAEREAEELKFANLLAQIKPHFLFNSLQSVKYYIADNQPQKAEEFLDRYADYFRFILDHSRKDSIPLTEELSGIDNFLQLGRTRHKGRFDFDIQVCPKIDLQNVMVPPMIAQPFVENSIKYGIDPSTADNQIDVSVKADPDQSQLIITIKDSGSKSPPCTKKHTSKTSKGIGITQKRIIGWGKNQGGIGQLIKSISEEGKSSKVEILLPLIQKF